MHSVATFFVRLLRSIVAYANMGRLILSEFVVAVTKRRQTRKYGALKGATPANQSQLPRTMIWSVEVQDTSDVVV